MTDDKRNQPPREPPALSNPRSERKNLSLVDAVYEVALDPSRYDELVDQWHTELRQAADLSNPPQDSPLAEHFNRASTIFQRVHRDDWQASTQPQAMPEVLLSRSGVVVQANLGAAALLSARVGQPIQSLDITASACEVLLEKCRNLQVTKVSQRAKPNAKETAVLLRIARLGDDRPLVVMLHPSTCDSKPVLALRCAEIVWPESLGPLLAEAFGLTVAECDIVQAMVAGLSAAQIAEDRGTSKETVRTQIRQLLAKTGTHSQLELIRMAIGFSMMSQQAEARADYLNRKSSIAGPMGKANSLHTAQPATLARSIVKPLASGSNFELVQYGPDSGAPILVFHDEVIGDAFVLPLLRIAPGYRWLVAVRSGYGESSQSGTADTPYPAGSAQMFDAVLQRVAPDLPAAPVLAHGNGIFFACQFARSYPERCTSITTLAASLPGNKRDADTNRYVAFIDGMRRLGPSMLHFAAQTGFAMYARVGSKRFLERVYGDSEADQDVIDSAQAMVDLEHGGRLTLAQGYRGFYQDEQTLVADWTEDFLGTPVPVRIVIGDQDQPDRRIRANALQSRSNSIELVAAQNAGFFAAFSASQTVTETLLRA